MILISPEYLIKFASCIAVPGRSQEQVGADCTQFVAYLSGFVYGMCPELALALDALSTSSIDLVRDAIDSESGA